MKGSNPEETTTTSTLEQPPNLSTRGAIASSFASSTTSSHLPLSTVKRGINVLPQLFGDLTDQSEIVRNDHDSSRERLDRFREGIDGTHILEETNKRFSSKRTNRKREWKHTKWLVGSSRRRMSGRSRAS